jgi:glycine cleavage system aminomethyltransferase T
MRTGYDAVGWSPIMGAEHLEMRTNVGLVDWSAAIAPIEVSGPGALAHLQHLCTANVDLPLGGVAYSLVLTPSGGVARDITVARMAEDVWWILTGRGNLPAELALFSSLAPHDGSVSYRDRGAGLVGIGLWGPNARAVLERASDNDISNEAFPWYTWRAIDVGMAPVTAIRLSYVGELGWEFYVPPAAALHVWDTLWQAGRALGMRTVGAKSVFSARLEKGYRLWGSDMTPEYTPAESGVAWAMDTSKHFRGKDAALAAPVRRRVVTLRFASDDAVVYGWEPVRIGEDVVGFVAAGEYGYSVGAFLAHAFVDAERATPGTAVSVQRTGVRHAATIVQSPLFDPTNSRLKS